MTECSKWDFYVNPSAPQLRKQQGRGSERKTREDGERQRAVPSSRHDEAAAGPAHCPASELTVEWRVAPGALPLLRSWQPRALKQDWLRAKNGFWDGGHFSFRAVTAVRLPVLWALGPTPCADVSANWT